MAFTSELYGHVVSVDAFGEAQVMPIQSTLDSIKEQMKAARVWLPNSEEIQLLQGTSRSPLPANMEVSPAAEGHENQEATPTIQSEDMMEDQSDSSPPSTRADEEASSSKTLSRRGVLAQSLEIAHESPKSASYPSIRQILESALEEIWAKVQNQPNSYVMTRDEFAVFNFFQDRFTDDKLAIAARKRYWESLSVGSSEPTATDRGHLDQIDAVRGLVQTSYRLIGAYGPEFADVATRLYRLETTLRRMRDEVVQDGILAHIQPSYSRHLHSLIDYWDCAMRQINTLLDTYDMGKKMFEEKQPYVSDELRPIESSLAGKKMAIELLLDSVQLQKPQIHDKRQSALEDIKDKVDLVAAQLFANWDASTFSGENDDLWRHFQTLLEKEGFSSRVLSKNKVNSI
ncbi:hypothetical protein IL306_004444 [Fusarium sp. DS 682]|nr:hypothetical protein IL306_004444 [Fusarium sp. DS 682]